MIKTTMDIPNQYLIHKKYLTEKMYKNMDIN